MTSPWLPQLRRHEPHRELLLSPFPAAWLRFLECLPFYRNLDAKGQERLRSDLRVLVREKHWHGRGLLVTDEIKVVIAAQAALLLLNLEHDYYANVHSIVVHPSRFVLRSAADGRPLARHTEGEARPNGAVVLAWDAVRRGSLDPHDGRNLVLHEFAHELDLQDGEADGRPPLGDPALRDHWARAWTAQLLLLREQVTEGRATLLDRYGAVNRAELFAVATECFFERGRELAQQHPQLYLLLWRYYGQDPAAQM